MESYLNLIRAAKMSVCQNYPAGNFVWCCSVPVNNLYEILIYIYFEQQKCLFICQNYPAAIFVRFTLCYNCGAINNEFNI